MPVSSLTFFSSRSLSSALRRSSLRLRVCSPLLGSAPKPRAQKLARLAILFMDNNSKSCFQFYHYQPCHHPLNFEGPNIHHNTQSEWWLHIKTHIFHRHGRYSILLWANLFHLLQMKKSFLLKEEPHLCGHHYVAELKQLFTIAARFSSALAFL